MPTEADILAVVYLGLIVVPSVICWLKGKRLWAVLGCLSMWHLIPMIRLGKAQLVVGAPVLR